MKIVHISTVHTSNDIRIFQKECIALAEAGHDVTYIVHTDKPEVRRGVKIVPLTERKGRVARMTATSIEAFRRALAEKADVYHFHDPELLPTGVLLTILGHKVIYDSHEDLAASMYSKYYLGKSTQFILSWVLGAFEKICSAFFWRIIAATPKIAESFPARKTVVIHNYPKAEELAAPATASHETRPNWMAYVGGISRIRSACEMVEAAAIVASQREFKLQLAGPFSPATLKDELESVRGWRAVQFRGTLDRRSVASLLSECKAGLVLFHRLPNHLEAQPNKIFEYLSAGLPIIASDFPLNRRLFADHGKMGLLVDPHEPRAIADAILWILDHPSEAFEMGLRGRHWVRHKFNWQSESQKLVGLFT